MSKSFSFTLTIYPEKKVYYAGKRRAYGSMNTQAQHKFLNDLLIKVIWHDHFEYIDWVFEEHTQEQKLKGLHVHGFTIEKPEYVNHSPTILMVNNFYSHSAIAIDSINKIRQLSNIQETRINLNFWLTYIEKNQDKIKFYSPVREQDRQIKNMDAGVVFIQYNNKVQHPQEWYDDINNGKEPLEDFDKKPKNKFIVEI